MPHGKRHVSNKDKSTGGTKKVSNILQLPNFRKGLSDKQVKSILPKPKQKKKKSQKGAKLLPNTPFRKKKRGTIV